jgi:MoaA/NifB/PqqE/SkfB family radical SAM enzyme
MSIPESVFLHLTKRCNLACAHCHVSSSPSEFGDITEATLQCVLDLMDGRAISDLRLTGGEPTAHARFSQVLEIVNERGYRPRLITNGIRLIGHDKTRALLSRLSGCWISLYGLTEEEHRQVAGAGAKSIDRILRFCAEADSRDCWIGVSVLLLKPSTNGVTRLVRQAAEYGVRRLRLIFSERDGRAATSGAFFSQSDDTIQSALSIVGAIRTENLHDQFDHISISDPFDLDHQFSGMPTHSCMLRDRRMWTIASDGTIYSCCFNVNKPAHACSH